jgi:hypothetical protein
MVLRVASDEFEPRARELEQVLRTGERVIITHHDAEVCELILAQQEEPELLAAQS